MKFPFFNAQFLKYVTVITFIYKPVTLFCFFPNSIPLQNRDLITHIMEFRSAAFGFQFWKPIT